MATPFIPGFAPEPMSPLNDRQEDLLDAANRIATLVVELSETILDTIADGEERAARDIEVEWVSNLLEGHARAMRELARLTASARHQVWPGAVNIVA
jgi:predicted transcriptional regulator